MSNESNEPRQRLLADTLCDRSFKEFEARVEQVILSEFRRARLWRSLRRISALAAATALMAGGLICARRGVAVDPIAARSSTVQSASVSTDQQTSAPSPVRQLTDDQLVSSFPPNTCYLAEVDGRKVLVFYVEADRREYLH